MAVEANGPGLAEVLTAEPAPAAAGGGAGECGMHSLATVPVPDVAASAPSIFNRVMQTNLQGASPLRCDCLRGRRGAGGRAHAKGKCNLLPAFGVVHLVLALCGGVTCASVAFCFT